MNGIFGLCHFCETHGPQIIFCTQALRAVEWTDAAPASRSWYASEDDCATSSLALRLPIRNVSSIDFPDLPERSTSASPCQHCGWLAKADGFLTPDSETNARFLSCHHPTRTELYEPLRHACVKALSVETSQRGSGAPFLFGNADLGFCFACNFTLSDETARGRVRQYALILLMSDHIHLVCSWPFLTRHCNVLIKDLQNCATMHYRSRAAGTIVDSPKPPQSQLQRITGIDSVWQDLHAYLTWMLKGCLSRLFERQIQGPGPLGSSATLDDILPEGTRPLDCSQVLQLMDIDTLMLVVCNLVVGNQIVLVGSELQICRTMVWLSQLLPARCCSAQLAHDTYEEPYLCNILGLTNEKALPEPIASECVVLECRSRQGQPSFKLKVHGQFSIDFASSNQLTTDIMACCQRAKQENVAADWLFSIRERWMHMAKAFFKVTRTCSSSPRAIAQLLSCMGLCESDLPVLRFWSQGLSRDQRSRLLRGSTKSLL